MYVFDKGVSTRDPSIDDLSTVQFIVSIAGPLADAIRRHTPKGRPQDMALDRLQEAIMWAMTAYSLRDGKE